MSKFTLTLLMAASVVVMLGILWVIWKYHFGLFKYFLLAFVFSGVVIAAISYRLRPVEPKRNPAIGRHAYLKRTGEYLGVVEGAGRDRQRGEVWFVRPPGGYPLMYGKSRVILKEVEEEVEPGKETEPNAHPK